MLFCLYLLVGFHWFHSVVWFRSKNGSDIALALKKNAILAMAQLYKPLVGGRPILLARIQMQILLARIQMQASHPFGKDSVFECL